MTPLIDDHQAGLDSLNREVIDLREYGSILRKNLSSILGFAVVTSAVVILIVFNMRPTYEGTATLLIEADTTNVVSINQVYDFGMGKSQYYATQFAILSNKDLTRRVIRKNQKAFEVYFDQEYPSTWRGMFENIFPNHETREDKMADFFTSNLSIDPIKDTQLVKISYDAKDATLAATLANDLAGAYIEKSTEDRLDMTKQAASWLAGKVEGLKEKLDESEQSMQAYRESEDLVDIDGVSTLIAKELDEASAKLAEARQARTEAENIVSQIDQLPDRNNIEALSSSPAVLKDGLVQKFKDEEGVAEQKLSELSKRYGDQHPNIIAARSDLETAKKNTAARVLKVVDGLRKECEVAVATETSLTKQMADLKDKAQMLNRKQYKLDELSREVDVNRQLYDTFFNRIKETSEAMDIKTTNARIVDPAIASSNPIKPKRALLSVLAVIMSLMTGILVTFLREALDSTIRNRDDVLFKLHSYLLGVLPLLKDQDKAGNAGLEFSRNSASSFAEAVRTIRTGVVLSGLDHPYKILLVTSSIPGEGKTTAAANLAAAFGQTGKTLLIDADMRRPALAKNLGIPLSSPGLSNLVAGNAEPEACIHRVESIGIDVIPAGIVPPNPLELLSSKRFSSVLAGLEKNYDRIIIDSAPCAVVSDALILSTFANAVIYVVKAESISINAVKSGLSRLRETKAPLAGVILNRVDIEKAAKYGDAYYGGYYDYYGYTNSTSKHSGTTID
jgi:capsular exopolysaccharide synthesis family protein